MPNRNNPIALSAQEIERIFITEFLRRMDSMRGAGVADPDEAVLSEQLRHDLDAAQEFAGQYRARQE